MEEQPRECPVTDAFDAAESVYVACVCIFHTSIVDNISFFGYVLYIRRVSISFIFLMKSSKFWIFLIAIILFAGVILFADKLKQLILVQNTQLGTTNRSFVRSQCPESWKLYQHNVIGITFCYPEKWGDPVTDPISHLTDLSAVSGEDEERDTLELNFNNETSSVTLLFFNDQYIGELYPNGRAHFFGPIDTIAKLKGTENICDYRVHFDQPWGEQGTLTERFNDCRNDVRVALVSHDEFFDFDDTGWRHSYNLKGWGYKKLENGYFNHVLITDAFQGSYQVKQPGLNLEQFFQLPSTDLFRPGARSLEQFEIDRREFEAFVHTVESVPVTIKVQAPFAAIPGEDADGTAIRQYYWFLTEGKLADAYAMYQMPSMPYETYQKQYGKLHQALPRDFRSKGDHRWSFAVDYSEENTEPTLYNVQMAVIDGKIKTLWAEEITSPKVTNGSLVAYARRIGSENQIVLVDSEQEKILAKAVAEYDEKYTNIGAVAWFSNPEFSPSGRYLLYRFTGWEWGGYILYDTKQNKELLRTNSFGEFGFAADDRFAYSCASGGMSGADARVWELPKAKVLYDAFADPVNQQYINVECRMSPENKQLVIELTQDSGDMSNSSGVKLPRIIDYDFTALIAKVRTL
jgi:hypothetical protein